MYVYVCVCVKELGLGDTISLFFFLLSLLLSSSLPLPPPMLLAHPIQFQSPLSAFSLLICRWLNVPAAFLVQLSIGSVYAWSIFNSPLTRELGVVAPAADDWQLGPVVHIFSGCAIFLGLSTAILGPWAEAAGDKELFVSFPICASKCTLHILHEYFLLFA